MQKILANLSWLWGKGFSPPADDPRLPLLSRLEGLSKVGLVSIERTGVSLSVFFRDKKKKDWRMSHVADFLEYEKDRPAVGPEAMDAIRNELKGQSNLCVAVGYNGEPRLLEIANTVHDDADEVFRLMQSPSEIVPSWTNKETWPWLTRRRVASKGIITPVYRETVKEVLTLFPDFNLLRVQSLSGTLMDMGMCLETVVSGGSHLGVVTDGCLIFVEIDNEGNPVDVIVSQESGESQGTHLGTALTRIHENLAAQKPLTLITSSDIHLAHFNRDSSPFEIAENAYSTSRHLGAVAMLAH